MIGAIGPKMTVEALILEGAHPSFARAFVRFIMRKDGW